MKEKDDKIGKSYIFFLEKEESNTGFKIEDLVQATGWSVVTAKTYLSKKWDAVLEKKGREYFVKNLSKYSKDEYTKLMSQKNKHSQDPFKPELDEDIERLVVKARESALLALDIYNRPATMFKSEGFIVMMIIAWTSLLHAIFHKKGITYNYKDNEGKNKYIDGDIKAWELSTCIKEYYKEDINSVKSNIEFMIGLRNKIEHRFAPKIDNHIGGECQSLLLNFDELLINEFGNYYALKDLMVFPLQTSNLRNSERTEVIKKFQGKHYDEIKEYIEAYRENISNDIYNDPKFSFRVYLVPKTGNHKNSSDMSMEFVKYNPENPDEIAAQKQLVTLIKEKIVKTGNPDGLKPKQVVELVEKQIDKNFKIHQHTQAWKYYKIRPSKFVKNHLNEFCYSDTAHEDYVYTPAWVDFLIRKMSNDTEYKSVLGFKG